MGVPSFIVYLKQKMLNLETKNQPILLEKAENEEKKADPAILYFPDKNSAGGEIDKNFLFQGSSGRIFINVIIYSVFSLGKKAKKTMREIGHELSWRTGRAMHSMKNGNLWKYVPARVFVLAVSCGAIAIFMIDSGAMSDVVYGSEKKYEAYSAVSEDIDGEVIMKKVGKNLKDARLAAIASNQCKEDSAKSQNSEMCGMDIKNKVLIDAEKKEEEARLAAERAAAAKKRAASAVPAGKVSCPEKNDGHPSKSKTKGKHMDEDCCPDPDEWPKPGCVYSARGYSIMLKGPVKKK